MTLNGYFTSEKETFGKILFKVSPIHELYGWVWFYLDLLFLVLLEKIWWIDLSCIPCLCINPNCAEGTIRVNWIGCEKRFRYDKDFGPFWDFDPFFGCILAKEHHFLHNFSWMAVIAIYIRKGKISKDCNTSPIHGLYCWVWLCISYFLYCWKNYDRCLLLFLIPWIYFLLCIFFRRLARQSVAKSGDMGKKWHERDGMFWENRFDLCEDK